MKTNKSKILAAAALLCVAAFIIIFGKSLFGGKHIKTSSNSGFDTESDFVKIMDVGQGDSILIYSNGYSAVIDAGLAFSANDICEDLEKAEIKNIDVMLITHQHMDHAGGLSKISKRYKISNLIIPQIDDSAETAETLNLTKTIVKKNKGNIFTPVQGMNFKIGEFTVTVLAYYGDLKEENDKSIILMAEIDGLKFLFTGDAESKTENLLLKEGLTLDCDVLKVGHHGSRYSTSKKFLAELTPKFAAISVGADNVYSHPSADTLDLLNSKNIKTFRTDKSGDIIFYAENGKIRTETEK